LYVAYSLLLGGAFLLALPLFAWRAARSGKYLASLRQRFGRGLPPLNAEGAPAVWVHAVSVGEVLVARPLVESLRRRLPAHRVYLSTTTLTGMALARQRMGAAHGVFFAPFDWRGPVRRALRAARPTLLVLVETELWPNLVHEARRAGARLAVVNGRLSPTSFRRYRLVRALLGRVLREIDLFLMQSEPHADRVRALGAPAERVRVPGNLKFDALAELPPPAFDPGPGPWWVAGSTMAEEEERVLEAFVALRAHRPGLRLLLAPRHPERFAEVAALAAARGLAVTRRTALDGRAPGGDVLVLDTIGELASLYAVATVAFVGGSLVPTGGHDVLEPAAAGRAVVVGPHMENFREIAEAFLAEDALVQVAGAGALEGAVGALLDDVPRREALGARARALVERHRGAVARTVEALASLAEPRA
jgi:3-deoxy-D-manno-octulosonic-acid transferase